MDDRPEGVEELSMRMSTTRTQSGLETQPTYSPSDLEGFDYGNDLGDPGQYPFTRGSFPMMYRSRMWTLRNIVGYGAPSDTRAGLKRAFESGSAGIDIVWDSPSQGGIDPDHPMAVPDVGTDGCSVACVDHLADLLQDIDVTRTDIAWHVTATIYPMLGALLRRQGKSLADMQGSHMPDYLITNPKGFGERLMPARLAHRMAVDTLEHVAKHTRKWACGFPQTYTARQRGVIAGGELAVGFAIVRKTLDDLVARGVDIDSVAPRLAWVCPADIDLFEDVAKYRALRRMWAKMMVERYGCTDVRSQRLRVACHTDGRALTYQRPLNNLMRATVQSLAAILGGVQSLETCTYDEAISIPTPEARHLAIATQQILIHETGVARVADPLGGSYYVESLTNSVEAKALELLEEIESRGIIEAIQSGWLEEMCDDINDRVDEEMAAGERIMVGVNAFQDTDEDVPARFDFDRTSMTQHLADFADWREKRDIPRLRAALAALKTAAASDVNIIPAMIDAFDADGTVGEVWGTFREGSGYTYDPFGVATSPLADASLAGVTAPGSEGAS